MPILQTDNLVSVQTYAANYMKRNGKRGCTVGYIYELIATDKVQSITIDNHIFIDKTKAKK